MFVIKKNHYKCILVLRKKYTNEIFRIATQLNKILFKKKKEKKNTTDSTMSNLETRAPVINKF